MLITPEFTLSQTETHLEIAIRAPFAKLRETEIFAYDTEFYFYSAPYHLHLNLPGSVCDTEQTSSGGGGESAAVDVSSSRVKFDADRQMFDVTLEKTVSGQYFEGLGLITSMISLASLPSFRTKNAAASSENENNNIDAASVIGGNRQPLIEEIESNNSSGVLNQLQKQQQTVGACSSSRNNDDESSRDEMGPVKNGATTTAAVTAVVSTERIIPAHFGWALDHECDYELKGKGDEEDSVLPEGRQDADDSDEATNIRIQLPGGGNGDSAYAYGFGNRFSNDDDGHFAKIQECFPDVVDFREPLSSISFAQRMKKKNEQENVEFSEDHYMANLFEPEDVNVIEKLITCDANSQSEENDNNSKQMPWVAKDYGQLSADDRRDLVEKLKNRNFLLTFEENVSIFLGLVDVLFAYAYDMRVTGAEHCAESGWNISKLSSVLSWFVEFRSLRSVCRSCFRRSLTYPLFRSFQLSCRCWRDVVQILQHGREGTLRALLDVRRVFSAFDSSLGPKYILNDLYITDYCVWIQKVNPSDLKSLTEAVAQMKMRKSELGLELELLEKAGLDALVEDAEEAGDEKAKVFIERVKNMLRNAHGDLTNFPDLEENNKTIEMSMQTLSLL